MTIAVNQEYKYSELCSIFNEKQKTGNARVSQLKRWRTLIDWIKPTTQIYRITEVFDEAKERIDGRKNNGGARIGAGAKVKLMEEFEYMLYCYIHYWNTRYCYSPKGGASLYEIHCTNKEISEYFGLYSNGFNKGYGDETINHEAFRDVCKKIAQIRQNWIYDKIKMMDDIELTNGIIAYVDKQNTEECAYRDDYLDEWNKRQKEYCEIKKCRSIGDVIERELWLEMIEYISCYFPGYKEVIKCKKIIVNSMDYFELNDYDGYSLELYERYRLIYNNAVVEALTEYFRKKTENAKETDEETDKKAGKKKPKFEDYIKVIDRYVKI